MIERVLDRRDGAHHGANRSGASIATNAVAFKIESAWHCRLKPAVSKELQKRQREAPAAACAIAWNAQQRLYKRYHRLVAKGKPPHKATVAVARELLGFIWAIAHVAPVSVQPQQDAA